MKVEVKQAEGLKRELNVEIPAETVQSEMDSKLAEIRRDTTLKGFRKGKAPMDMIRQMYTDQVKADVVDKLIRESFPQAVTEKELKVASAPQVTNLDLTDDLVLTYTAEIEVLPEVKSIDTDGLEVEEHKIEVTDNEVDEFVERIRYQNSELKPVDREAKAGDVVVCDLHKIEDEKGTLPDTDFPDSQIDLGNPMTLKEFNEELPGVKAGDEKDIKVTYADDYPDAKFAGAKITYHATVKSINERELPEFDDTLAKTTGQAETALELKIKIRENIENQKKENVQRLHKRDVMRQVVEKNQVEIPEGMLNEYLESVVQEVKSHGGSEMSDDEIRAKYRPAGLESMRWDLLWRTFADQQKIEVLPEDTENWINGFAAANQTSVEHARTLLTQSGKVNQLRDSLLEGKVLEHLINGATKVPPKAE